MRPANSVGSPAAGTAGSQAASARISSQSDWTASAGLLVGGYYRLGARIGAGGEGESFRAVDERSGETCALKLFRGSAAPAGASRVRREFQRLRALSHPGIVAARDLGRHEGRLYLVTELLTGPTLTTLAALEDVIERRARWTRAARELADALAYLHGNGVVHGDVSPENVRIASDGRAVLIDFAPLGLANTGGAVGTLGFAAPEALIGRLTPASDLFAYGATLFRAWTGSAPFGDGGAAVARMLAAPAPALSSLRAGLSAEWDDLVASLLQREPERRPASARVVLRTVARLSAGDGDGVFEATLEPPYPTGDPLAGTFVDRAEPRALLKDAFERLAEASCTHAVIAIVGPEGSGRRSLIDVALRDLAVAQSSDGASPLTVFRGSLGALFSWLGLGRDVVAEEDADEPIRARQKLFARAVAALDTRARAVPLLLVLGTASADREFALFVAGAPAAGQWLTVLPVALPLGQLSALDISLPPLDARDIRELVTRATGEEATQAAVDRIVRASAGHAATVCVLTRQLVRAFREGAAERFAPAPDLALDQLLTRTFAQLSPAARRFVAHVALRLDPPDSDGPDPDDKLLSPRPDGEVVARSAGWLVGEAAAPALPSEVHRMVVRRALAEPDLREIARHVLTHAVGNAGTGARGICLEALGRPVEAAREFLAAAAAARGGDTQAGRGAAADEAAATWLEEAARLAPRLLSTAEILALTNALAWQGRTEAALALVTGALDGFDGASPAVASVGKSGAWADRLYLVERRAWLLMRAGLLTAARDILERVLALTDTDWVAGEHREIDRARSRARARLARVLVSLGHFAEALRVAVPVPDESVAAALSVESAILAHAYGGGLPAARHLRDEQGGRLSPARAAYLDALLDQLAGALPSALDRYQRALAAAEAVADIHTVAAIALNMGALAAEAGRYDQALAMQDRAIRELGRLGAASELEVALFNAAMLLIDLGEMGGARGLVNRLRRAGAGQASLSIASLSYLEAELAVRDGDLARATKLFASASEAAGLDAAVGQAARLARAELLARAQRADEARALLDACPALHPDGRVSADVQMSRARVLLAGGGVESEVASTLATVLGAAAEDAAREGRRPRAWRGALTAARLFHRAGRTAEAVAAAARAKQLFEEIRMSTPIDHRPGLERDADAQFLADLSRLAGSGAEAADPTRAGRGGSRAEDRLRRLLRINKRLNSELRLPRLLELIMDTVIELTEAERGFILLDDEKGELTVKIARNIDQQTLDTDAFNISRSIASQAALGGAPIVTIDAAGDPRFREALSVSDLHLRSVLAVPLQVKGRAVGTLYVDNRLRKGAFSDDDVQLVLDFAEQAGIAIENARLLGEVRRRERQIEVLNRRLQSELAVRKEELVGMKQELRESRDALAIRYDYRNIVGRTPRMLDLFHLLDRLTDTALPVVIQGESGTGKELVARALHFNGPRRERPFVSENCAAIPETLLEATLFGSVRGAYTGADHDSRGLFEVADGGTLFLDEVGEMSPAMQGKLLRVLQSGELRRVGSERTRKVEVRVIAATNRDLARMVEEGRFRQDLFFRLSVAAIVLPPLRDRREDIPAIVEHVLERLGRDKQTARGKTAPSDPARRRVTPAALARLCAYRWPGNVRELENELMRAAAMSDGQIDVGDLSPAISGNAEAALTALDDSDDLSLRPRVERLERALLREALSRCSGNQTRAAVALGLSRFGLQKKMQRYKMG